MTTAWERWELASFDATPDKKAAATPAQVEETPLIKLPTAEELEQIHQQAHDEGFQKGKDEGYQAGFKEGQKKAASEAQRLGKLAGKLDDALKALDEAIADEVLALAVELAREVIRQEITARPEALLDVVRAALAQLPHQHAAIYLHPEDASLLRSYLGDQLTHAGHRIHEDFKLSRGDCILEAGSSQVDGTVAVRWRRVIAGLGIESAWQPLAVPPAPTFQEGGEQHES